MFKSTLALSIPLIAAGAFISEDAQAADRVVLAENFTATWCTYCPSVSSGLLQVMDENPGSIVGFQVHGSDDYTCSWGNSRLSFYSVSGFPTVWMDGWWSQVGSYGSVGANATALTSGMNACLNRATDVTFDSAGEEISNSQYKVTWEVGVESGGSSKSVRLYSVQMLDVWPTGGSHYFNCVIQHQNETTLSLTAGVPQTIEHTYTLSGASLSNKDDVRYMAWVQDISGSGPAQIHNVEYHEHGQLPPSTVTVGPSGDYATISDAINGVGEYSTINVAPGTYGEHLDLEGKNLTIIGTEGPEATIIDGMGTGIVLNMLSDENDSTTIDGLTITNGYASLGAGVRCNSNPMIRNCIISNNNANNVIAGLMSSGPSGPTLDNVEFCNNVLGGSPDSHIWGNWTDGGNVTFQDDCETTAPCDGDFDDTGSVNVNDLLTVIAGWGDPYNVDDLLLVIANWGSDC